MSKWNQPAGEYLLNLLLVMVIGNVLLLIFHADARRDFFEGLLEIVNPETQEPMPPAEQ